MKRIGLIIAFIFCAVISYGQQIHSGGINIATGFKLSDPQPIDDRYVVQDSLSLLSIPNIYTGLWAYSLGDSSVFVYDGLKWERIVDMELAMTLISTFPKDTNTLNEVLAKGGNITADREIVSTNRDLGFMSFDEFVIDANSVTMDVNDSVLVKVNGKGVSVKEDSVEINVRTRYKDAYTFVNDRDLPDAGWVKKSISDTFIAAIRSSATSTKTIKYLSVEATEGADTNTIYFIPKDHLIVKVGQLIISKYTGNTALYPEADDRVEGFMQDGSGNDYYVIGKYSGSGSFFLKASYTIISETAW